MKANGTGATSVRKNGKTEKHKSWGMPAEGFKGHVTTDGSLLETPGKWGVCGWSVVRLHGMYGSMEAVLEVQRTIKRAKLTAFLCLLNKVIGPIKVHVDKKGIIDGLWKGESKGIDPKAGDADLWKNWEELYFLVSKNILAEVEHVKAHRTQKDKKEMSHFERFVADGNEKADELAKAGAMLDEGFMADARAKTVQQELERKMQLCSMQPVFTVWWAEWKDCEELKLEEHKAQMQDRFLRGRQIAEMIYEYFRVTGAHEAVLDCSDLCSITFHGDDIQDFDNRWDTVL